MESSEKPQNIHQSYRMAWTAYIRPVIAFAIIVAIGVTFGVYDFMTISIAFYIAAFLLLTIKVLTIRSLVFYTNDDGVWVYSGIFPWSKGHNGVKWRDLEDAIYVTGFFSWALKSYTVRVGHRFTKSSEIVLPHIARGNLAVEHINTFHNKILSIGKSE